MKAAALWGECFSFTKIWHTGDSYIRLLVNEEEAAYSKHLSRLLCGVE